MVVKYLVDNNIPKDVKIADFGCGTGLLGIDLAKAGYTDVIGVDGSPEMLEVCKQKGVYKSLHKCLIGSETLDDLNDQRNSFDVIVSSACMIKGHFPNTVFDTFLDFMKPQTGIMVFSIRDIYINSETDSGMNYHGAMAERVEKQLMEKVHNIHFTKYLGLNEFGVGYCEEGANIMVYRKL